MFVCNQFELICSVSRSLKIIDGSSILLSTTYDTTLKWEGGGSMTEWSNALSLDLNIALADLNVRKFVSSLTKGGWFFAGHFGFLFHS